MIVADDYCCAITPYRKRKISIPTSVLGWSDGGPGKMGLG